MDTLFPYTPLFRSDVQILPLSIDVQTWVELVLTTPVVLWAGWPFFERCVQSIRNRSPNMFTLIGIGVAAAFGYSLVATLAPGLFPPSFTEHRSEEHTSELQSLMRLSYAVFCL